VVQRAAQRMKGRAGVVRHQTQDRAGEMNYRDLGNQIDQVPATPPSEMGTQLGPEVATLGAGLERAGPRGGDPRCRRKSLADSGVHSPNHDSRGKRAWRKTARPSSQFQSLVAQS
jgi:hypothetical protein